MRIRLLLPIAFYIGAGLLMLVAPGLVAQTGAQQASAPSARINLPALRSPSLRKQVAKKQSQLGQPQAKLAAKTRSAQQHLTPAGQWQVQANHLVWQPLPRATQPQPLALAQVNWQAAQQAQQQLLRQLQVKVMQRQLLPKPQAQATSRNLLFTPEDAAKTQTFHPLLTPDISAYVVPVTVSAEPNPVVPHK